MELKRGLTEMELGILEDLGRIDKLSEDNCIAWRNVSEKESFHYRMLHAMRLIISQAYEE